MSDPRPGDRSFSRTRWPLWKVLLYAAAEVAVAALSVAGLVWLLARS